MRRGYAPAALTGLGLALLTPSGVQAQSGEVTELRRMVRELQAQNRQLSQRLDNLENARRVPLAPQAGTLRTNERSAVVRSAAQASTITVPSQDAPVIPGPRDTTGMPLEQRVKDLEAAQAAQELATRQIIQDSLVKTGPKINQFVALSGAIEVVGARSEEFYGPTRDRLELGTAELDFDVTLNEWLTGAVVLGFDSGIDLLSPAISTAVDRFTLDRTHISIGNFERFPIGLRFGREVLPFGTSTGVARLDTLSIGTPLTTEVFENRQTAATIEFAFPTPPLGPPAPPVVVPKAQPQFIAPLVSNWMRLAGYRPLPQRILPPVPVTPPVDPPPFYGSFSVYKGSEFLGERTRIEDFNASVGYRTRGHCGQTYEELTTSLFCPWQLDVHVDYNSSVFDSKFLERNYLPLLTQIGRVPGVAASVKASFGPFAVVGEVNSAVDEARFVDALGLVRSVQPMTWQLSLAYQFDWNPWITEIGAQGSFISIGYSGSKDMEGYADLIGGVPTRVGFVPRRRLLLTFGEWVMDGLKVAVEYSANWDYPLGQGGTGDVAHGILGSVQLNF